MVLFIVLYLSLSHLLGHGTNFSNPDGSINISCTSDAIVDNTTNGLNDPIHGPICSEQQLTHAFQTQAQTWAQLLFYSGGKLQLHKCLTYILVYQWLHGHPQLTTKSQLQSTLTITCPCTTKLEQICIFDPSTSHSGAE